VGGRGYFHRFTVPYTCTQARLFCVNYAAGTFDVVVNGVVTTVTVDASKRQKVIDLGPVTAGWVIDIRNQSAANVIAINGIALWKSLTSGFWLGRVSVSGDQGNTALTRPWNVNQLSAPAGGADVVLIELGVNDAAAGASVAPYRTALLALSHAARRSRPNCTLIYLVAPVPMETNDEGLVGTAPQYYGAGGYAYHDYVDAMYSVARSMYGAVVDWQAAAGETFTASGYNAGGIHPVNAGHILARQLIGSLFPTGSLS
jgi:lysophospholipase L1-like esterase